MSNLLNKVCVDLSCRMKSLLNKFRFAYSDVKVIDDIHVKPSPDRYLWCKSKNALFEIHIIVISQTFSYLLASSVRRFDEMIEPFRLHEGSKDTAQAEAMQREQPGRITDKELNLVEDKVKPHTYMLDFTSCISLTCK